MAVINAPTRTTRRRLRLPPVFGGGAPAGNPELFPDPGIDTPGNFTQASGSGGAIGSGQITYTASAASTILLTASPAAAMQAALSDNTIYDIVLTISGFTAFTSGNITLKGAATALTITGNGAYAFQATSGTGVVNNQSFRLTTISGTFNITDISVKLH